MRNQSITPFIYSHLPFFYSYMHDLFLGQILSHCSDSVSNIQKLSYGGELEVEIVVESQMIEPDFNHKVHRIP